jgi:hypothetical protein
MAPASICSRAMRLGLGAQIDPHRPGMGGHRGDIPRQRGAVDQQRRSIERPPAALLANQIGIGRVRQRWIAVKHFLTIPGSAAGPNHGRIGALNQSITSLA